MIYAGAVFIVVMLLIVLVAIHELGHYIPARLLGFTVHSLAFGVPLEIKQRRLIRRFFHYKGIRFWIPWLQVDPESGVWTPCTLGTIRIGGIELVISWLLIGGGVNIPDDEYWSAPAYKRIMVALYGPLVNIASGLLVAMVILGYSLGWQVSIEFIRASFTVAYQLITFQIPASALSGPVEAVRTYSHGVAAEPYLGSLFTFLMWTNLIPAINILPIPAVDGGHVLMSLLAAPFGEPGRKAAMWISRVFFYVLSLGMLFLIVRDLIH